MSVANTLQFGVGRMLKAVLHKGHPKVLIISVFKALNTKAIDRTSTDLKKKIAVNTSRARKANFARSFSTFMEY